jgi:hypothetical protein
VGITQGSVATESPIQQFAWKYVMHEKYVKSEEGALFKVIKLPEDPSQQHVGSPGPNSTLYCPTLVPAIPDGYDQV